MLLKLKIFLLKFKSEFAYAILTFQKCKTITKFTKNKPVLSTKKDKRSNALITTGMMSALFDPAGQQSRLS